MSKELPDLWLPDVQPVDQDQKPILSEPASLEDILTSFLQELGLKSPEELIHLQKSGELDKLIGRATHYVGLLALSVLTNAIRQGELSEHALVSLATKLPLVAQKLSGTDINKHLILDEEKLKSLLEGQE